jgi:hypothetical protein
LAQAIRAERQEPITDHPMPTTKNQIRNPGLLDGIKQTISKIVETISGKSHVA